MKTINLIFLVSFLILGTTTFSSFAQVPVQTKKKALAVEAPIEGRLVVDAHGTEIHKRYEISQPLRSSCAARSGSAYRTPQVPHSKKIERAKI